MWDQSRYALDFFHQHSIPFWNMTNANKRVTSNSWCLIETNDEVIVVYIRDGGTAAIDTNFPYLISWYDPRNGGVLQFGSKTQLAAGRAQELGTAPNNPNMDWVVLLKMCPDCRGSSSDGGTQTGLIAGLVVAAIVVVALAIYLGIRHSHGRLPRSRKNELDRQPPEPVDELVHPSDIRCGLDPPASSSGTGSRSSIAARSRSIESGSPDNGPGYKDQVRPTNTEDVPTAGSEYIPTVAAKEVDESEHGQDAGGYYRVDL